MRQGIRSHLTYANVMATIAVFIALGGTTYAATGGNFILGQSNTAGAPTQLSSATTNAAGALKVTNTNTTTAGRGISALGGAGGFGLWASGGNANKNTAAIHGQSTAGNAVEGISGSNVASGVYGQNNSTGYGVAGRSTNGTAVLGDSSSGWAINASGHATQSRAKDGFVKAMAYIDPSKTDKVRRCFNSQLSADKATVPLCGITLSNPSEGLWDVDFGFYVGDRFALATSNNINANVGVGVSGNTVTVRGWNISNDRAANVPFFVVVF
jgi:hypothetical protein